METVEGGEGFFGFFWKNKEGILNVYATCTFEYNNNDNMAPGCRTSIYSSLAPYMGVFHLSWILDFVCSFQ